MKVLPVLDILDGLVVRGVAGDREKYRPVESIICESARPLDVARAFRHSFSLRDCYVADLDAILENSPNLELLRRLSDDGFLTHVDAGIRNLAGVTEILNAGAASVILGLETCPGPQLLHELCEQHDPGKLIFSLDFRDNRLLGDLSFWESEDPLAIIDVVVEAGIRQLIVLDLAQVGVGQGVETAARCVDIKRRHPECLVWTGGGVRNADDLRSLKALGVDGVLVASALHNGALTPDDLTPFQIAIS